MRGLQRPRIEHAPQSRTTAGQDVIDFAAAHGLHLDPWQQRVVLKSFGERDDGKWQCFEVGLVVSRQNGKGAILEAVVLAHLFLFDARQILFSAHEMKTAVTMYKRIRDLVKGSPELHQQVKKNGYYQSNERTSVELADGREVRFVARSTGSARGFSADVLIFDEAFNLPDDAADAQLPTTGARPNPQVWYTSSAADKDLAPCDVLGRIRRRGIKGESTALAYFEWSAEFDEDTRKLKGDPSDPRVMAQANPSMGLGKPYSKTVERIASLQESLSAEGYAREELSVGNWPTPDATNAALDYATWRNLADPTAERGSGVVFGVDVDESRGAWISVGWRKDDGSSHLMMVNDEPIPAYAVTARCKELTAAWGGSVVPPRAFEQEMSDAGVPILPMKAGDFPIACGALSDAVTAGVLHHGNQASLNAAVRAARWRSVGTAGEKAWQLKDCPEIGPLAAATRAFHKLGDDYDVMDSIF